MNDSTAISWFHCLSARSRATRGRSRRWGRETTPHREGEKITRSRAGTGNRAGNRARHGRRAANARTAPTALRRPRAFADQHPFVVTRQSIRIIPSRSRGRVDQLAARSFEFLLIAIAARRARARRLFSRAFRSSRSSVPSASPSVVFPVPRVVLPPLPPPRFPPRLASVSSPGRARCRDIGIFIRSFGWTRCSVLRVMTLECTRAQTTTSYDSRYMECTPGYIRWRSSRRLESRPPRSRRSSRAIDGARTRFRPRRSRAIVRSYVRSFVRSIASFVVDALGVRRPHAGPRKPPPAWDETTTTTMGRDSVRAINSTCPPSGFRAHTGRRARRVCVGTSCINVGNERNERNDDASRSRVRRLASTPSLTARK